MGFRCQLSKLAIGILVSLCSYGWGFAATAESPVADKPTSGRALKGSCPVGNGAQGFSEQRLPIVFEPNRGQTDSRV